MPFVCCYGLTFLILADYFLPKENAMFHQLFSKPFAVARHHSLPFANERQQYLLHLMEEGRSWRTLENLTHVLVSIAQHLPLQQPFITRDEIEISAEAWSRTTHRSATCRHLGRRQFVFHATNWMRLLGRLQEHNVKGPFAEEIDTFLHFCLQERALSPSTLFHYRVCVGEFLVWLDLQRKTLREVTLEDISSYLQTLAQRKLRRTSIALHIAKLRNFFRYAESKRWCRAGLAAIDAPRIYRLESLPRGPQWSDVQRLLTSCRGDMPTEIRDHAMLLLLAVYGMRGGEVRHLRLEDIDWEREIIHIRRSKQRKSQHYPLVHEVGSAILRYLREARPRCQRREIFLTRVQPYRALTAGGFAQWCASVCNISAWFFHAMVLMRCAIPVRRIYLRKASRSRRSQTTSVMCL
jgi:site-specific recombinase XerD